MLAFDRAMNHLDKAFSFIASPHEFVSRKVGLFMFGILQCEAAIITIF